MEEPKFYNSPSITTSLAILLINEYDIFKKKGIALIPNTSVCKDVFLRLYKNFTDDKTFERIEDLPEDKKILLTQECRRTNKFYTNKTLIEDCKILYVILGIKGMS